MLRVNGVPLNNPALGWVFRPGSRPYSALEKSLAGVKVAGRDGEIPAPATVAAPLWPLKVNTPPEGWQALQALFLEPTLTLTDDTRPGISVAAGLATSTVDHVFTRNEWIDVTYIVQLHGAYWRDIVQADKTFPLSQASTAVTFWPGMTAPVADALIRLRGPHTGTAQITDSSGAWVTLPAALATEWVVFNMATGEAGRNTDGSWNMTTDVSGSVDFGGPRGVFEITAKRDPANPSARTASLTVSRAAATAAEFAVRGRAAYIL